MRCSNPTTTSAVCQVLLMCAIVWGSFYPIVLWRQGEFTIGPLPPLAAAPSYPLMTVKASVPLQLTVPWRGVRKAFPEQSKWVETIHVAHEDDVQTWLGSVAWVQWGTRDIWVNPNWLSKGGRCQLESLLVHEMIHVYQNVYPSSVSLQSREEQAYWQGYWHLWQCVGWR